MLIYIPILMLFEELVMSKMSLLSQAFYKPPHFMGLKFDRFFSKGVKFKSHILKPQLQGAWSLTKVVFGLGILIPSIAIAQEFNHEKQSEVGFKRSSFETAATTLGFDSAAKQEALLKIFYYAGYLDPHRLWADLNSIEGIRDHALEAFELIYPALVESNVAQANAHQFHPEILRTKLFGGLNEQESADLLLYIAQHAFNRKLGQERNELKAQDWMAEHKVEYIEAARELGLIDRIDPSYEVYDQRLDAGASRIGVLARAIDAFNTISSKKITIKGETSELAGQRELWAEIDGITPTVLDKLMHAAKNNIDMDLVDVSLPVGNNEARTEEGKKYIIALAARSNIELDKAMPLIQCATKAQCPAGREPGRWYPNYATGEGRKLTESVMAQDVLKSVAADKYIKIVDTAASSGGARPNTATTATDAAKNIVVKIKAGEYGNQKEFFIFFQSNQPYIERQTLVTQAAFDEVLVQQGVKSKGYTITIDGVGFGNKQDVATIHSELGALGAERMKSAMRAGLLPQHDLKDLLFQTRDSNKSVPDYPDMSKLHPIHVDLGGVEVSAFDSLSHDAHQ